METIIENNDKIIDNIVTDYICTNQEEMRTCNMKLSLKCLGTVHDPNKILIRGKKKTSCLQCRRMYGKMFYKKNLPEEKKIVQSSPEILLKKLQIAELMKDNAQSDRMIMVKIYGNLRKL